MAEKNRGEGSEPIVSLFLFWSLEWMEIGGWGDPVIEGEEN